MHDRWWALISSVPMPCLRLYIAGIRVKVQTWTHQVAFATSISKRTSGFPCFFFSIAYPFIHKWNVHLNYFLSFGFPGAHSTTYSWSHFLGPWSYACPHASGSGYLRAWSTFLGGRILFVILSLTTAGLSLDHINAFSFVWGCVTLCTGCNSSVLIFFVIPSVIWARTFFLALMQTYRSNTPLACNVPMWKVRHTSYVPKNI